MADKREPEVPVYIFLGLLESGKTTVISDFLSSNQFEDSDFNLVIACEEGEAEIDEQILRDAKATVVTVTDRMALTTAFLTELDAKYRPTGVLIEYNGMWPAADFMAMDFPSGWFEFQNVGLVNAETYEVYQKNMKDRFMDVFRFSDVVVFNRCDAATRQQAIRRNIKVVNNKAKVYFESEAPNFVEEPPELPYSLDKSPIAIGVDDYGAFMADIQEHPARYDKKTIKTDGFVGAALANDGLHCVFGRLGMACCADDMMFLGFKGKGDIFNKLDGRKRERRWGTVTGDLAVRLAADGQIQDIILTVKKFAEKPWPKDPVVYFN